MRYIQYNSTLDADMGIVAATTIPFIAIDVALYLPLIMLLLMLMVLPMLMLK